MKYPATQIDIRIAIIEHSVIVNSIPPQESLPICEVLEVGIIPQDCMAWIAILDKEKA